MHVHRVYSKRNGHILVIGKKTSSILKQRVRIGHILKHSGFHNAAILRFGSLVHQFSASIVHGFNGQVFIADRNQHGKNLFRRCFLGNIQNISAELNILNGAVAGFRNQIDVGHAVFASCHQIAAAILDNIALDVIIGCRPVIACRIDGNLLVIERARFKIFEFFGSTRDDNVPVLNRDLANRESLFRIRLRVMGGNSFSEKVVGGSDISFRFLNAVNQIGQFALRIDLFHIVESAVMRKHSPAKQLCVIQINGNHRLQLSHLSVISVCRRHAEFERASFSKFKRQPWR